MASQQTEQEERMSRMRQMIELFAPAVIREHRSERFTVKGFTCPECQGNGWWWKNDGKDYEKASCRVCNGTGEVDAEVTIQWRGSDGCDTAAYGTVSSGKTAACVEGRSEL